MTGSSRGAGRAIAHVLGEAGATVYVTGRSAKGGQRTEGLPGSVDETAAEVTRRGGRGVAVRVDHSVDADVEALFERVRREQGRLDVLVNNVWGGYEAYDGVGFDAPFWEQPLDLRWQGMFVSGMRAHFVATRYASSLLMRKPDSKPEVDHPGLIVNTVGWAYGAYLQNLYYDVAKAGIIRMAFGLAQELRAHRVAAVAVAPGFMRTERVMAAHEKDKFDLGPTESPEYLGRAIVALAADPRVMEKTGLDLTAGDLAREYGFTDVDGRQPEGFRIPGAALPSTNR
ncbi:MULTISPECIES: SDR family NAD(P)-dependent oxidoreductase [unclassified Myxococcus]|uniref:SDR family NAD(P)-dependent oxidoreductase n=1 Tax=unclassified Myxococcus TaxID=2648731 RepID=UPI001C3CE386